MAGNAPNLPERLAYCETDECFNVTEPGAHCQDCRDARLLRGLSNRQIRTMIERATFAEVRAKRRPWMNGDESRFTWERVLLRLNGEAFRRVDAGSWGDNPLVVR